LPQDVVEAKSISAFRMELDTSLRVAPSSAIKHGVADTAFGGGNP